MGVVKSEAYGHGAVKVARLLEAEGASWLAVSNVNEGIALREAGIRSRILVMAGLLPAEREALFDHGLTPVVHVLAELPELDRMATARREVLRYHLKVDSGMGRLGTLAGPADILKAVREARHTRLEGLMTHLASPADYTSDQTDAQIDAFDGVLGALRRAAVIPEWVHLSSSNPVAYGRTSAWRNLVRVGLALYGYISPARGAAPRRILDVKPALSWKAAILTVKEVPEGARIGYSAMFRATQPMRIAVLAVGYADGYPHQLSNRGKVIAGGELVPILGAVSMDMMTIDISHAPHLKPGDTVTLLGCEGDASLDAQQIAQTAGTIPYSVLCGIHPRVMKVYV
jgi:alanine racemase